MPAFLLESKIISFCGLRINEKKKHRNANIYTGGPGHDIGNPRKKPIILEK
jgi:hypothetical protein